MSSQGVFGVLQKIIILTWVLVKAKTNIFTKARVPKF